MHSLPPLRRIHSLSLLLHVLLQRFQSFPSHSTTELGLLFSVRSPPGFPSSHPKHHLLHKRCLQSIPGAHLKEPVHDGISTHIGAYLPPSFLPTPTGALCRVCKSGYGSLVKCHHKSCNNHFHLSCLNPSCHFFTPTSEGVAPTFPVHV